MNYTLAMRFIDANILLYSLDFAPANATKNSVATDILRNSDLALSIQVLQEFYVQATHSRRTDAISHDIAVRLMQKWMRFRIQENTREVLESALTLKDRFHISFWDASILAAAKSCGCKELLSEDLNHGQDYEGITVINPFKGH